MDKENLNQDQAAADSFVFGSALAELEHVVQVCLEHDASAIEAIEAVTQCAAMGCSKYPVTWVALDPRIHFFHTVEAALANALLSVPADLKTYLAEEKLRFNDLLCSVSKRLATDKVFWLYAVIVGLNDVFTHVTVGRAVSAGIQDRADGESDYGF